MALSDLAAPAATISDEDKLAQTAKLIERTFGRPAEEWGSLSIVNGAPAFTFEHNGTHVLTWERDRNSAPVFKVDGKVVSGLGGEGSALRLVRWLDA